MSERFIKRPVIISLDGLRYVSVYPSHAARLTGSYVQYKLIDDSVKVKDVLMLKCPTEAMPELSHLFDYQLTVLNSIRMRDEQLEAANNEVCGYSVVLVPEFNGAYRPTTCWNGSVIQTQVRLPT